MRKHQTRYLGSQSNLLRISVHITVYKECTIVHLRKERSCKYSGCFQPQSRRVCITPSRSSSVYALRYLRLPKSIGRRDGPPACGHTVPPSGMVPSYNTRPRLPTMSSEALFKGSATHCQFCKPAPQHIGCWHAASATSLAFCRPLRSLETSFGGGV